MVPLPAAFRRAALLAVVLACPLSAVADDGSAAGLPVYDLADCVAIALQESPTLAVAAENTGIAGQGVRQAKGQFLPSLSLSRTWQKSERTEYDYENPVTLAISDYTEKSKYKDYGASSDFYLFRGLSDFGGLKSARNDLRAAEASEAYSRQQVIENVAAAYIDLLRSERLLDVAIQSEDLAVREFEKSETYHRIGSAARSDVLSAKVRQEQTRLEVIRARNAVAQAFANLAHAMNRPLAERFDVDRSLLDHDDQIEDLDGLFAEAVTNRQDLLSRHYNVEARGGDVMTAGSGLYPQVRLFARYSRTSNESRFTFGAAEGMSVSYGYTVNWNIFDRFTTLAGRSQAKARQRIAEYYLDQAELDAQLEVRQLYNSQVEARERLALSRETIANAQEQLRLAQERFKVGAGTMLDQITAQVNLATAQSDEVQAISDFRIASFRLDRAVGRPLEGLTR
jgi:outer membrane protein TolC